MAKDLLDLQDEMSGALLALEGLRDLLFEVAGPKRHDFDIVSPEALAELLGMVTARFHRASGILEEHAGSVRAR